MRKLLRSLILFLALAAALGTGLAQAGEVVSQPFAGITHICRTETLPRPVTMHIVEIDLAAPGISFKLTPPGGTRDTVRQTTLEFLNQEHAQVAVNVHFFLPFPSTDTEANVVGLAASQGQVYSPFESQPIGDGYVDQSYAIIPWAPALNIDADNHAAIVHRDGGYPDNKHVVESVKLWNAVAGSAQIVTDGVKTLPTYSGSTGGLTPNGKFSDNNSWYVQRRARTAIGLTRDNRTLVLFTVDAAGGSAGMTHGEVADLLIKDYHVYNALGLDGGGSTTLAMEDPATHVGGIVNVSGDDPRGRAVGSNLAVFVAPVSVPAIVEQLILLVILLIHGLLAGVTLFLLIRRKRLKRAG
jgi:hypothetical protein